MPAGCSAGAFGNAMKRGHQNETTVKRIPDTRVPISMENYIGQRLEIEGKHYKENSVRQRNLCDCLFRIKNRKSSIVLVPSGFISKYQDYLPRRTGSGSRGRTIVILQARLTHEGSIPTSKTPKISFSCGLDKKSKYSDLDFFIMCSTDT